MENSRFSLMLVLERFLVIVYQVDNQFNLETFSLDTFQSVWTRTEVSELLLISSLMRGTDRDARTWNDYFAFFSPDIVTLFQVTEVTYEVMKTPIKSSSVLSLSIQPFLYIL